MKTEVRERLFLPLMVPLGVLAAIVVIVGAFAAILLWNTREGAVALALAAAGGVLFAVSMLASRDDLDTPRKTVAVGAGLLPVLVGAGLALTGGGVGDESALNINREPHEVIPEDAPRIGAVNAQSFCALQDGDCTETHEFELQGNGELTVVFENRDEGVPHNFAVYGQGDDGPDRDTALLSSQACGNGDAACAEIITGTETAAYTFTAEAGTYTFICDVHPNMIGTLTVS